MKRAAAASIEGVVTSPHARASERAFKRVMPRSETLDRRVSTLCIHMAASAAPQIRTQASAARPQRLEFRTNRSLRPCLPASMAHIRNRVARNGKTSRAGDAK
jgi:hypothetical protein